MALAFVLSPGMAAGAAAAQVVTAQADARGIPTVAPLIDAVDDAVVNIAVVSERPAQMTPLFRGPFFQPFLPPFEQMPPQRQMSAGSGVIVDAREGYVLTNNPLERIMREIRRRTRVVGAFPDGKSCVNLASARLRHIAGTQWAIRRYMNMAPLFGDKTQGAVVA